ncbi:(2Fe-2S)-binding protein [Mycobacterium asiaticum]|uniref:(2Fe-2S)-binding protein n=1 Tax=Mycobacterium asiaticum TaxID=1790 RepID=UPI0009BEDFC0|nr:(2Fe-2S)-binding protein [Mycobacterium asiaticum]
MFVCLCYGITSQMVADAVADGATTTNQVASACGAGADCGRCRRTVRAIITSSSTTGSVCLRLHRPDELP